MKVLFAFILAAACVAVSAKPDKIFCYYGSWTNYRTGAAEAKLEQLNVKLCTHFIYTFVGINAAGDVKLLDSWLDIDLRALERLQDMRKVNPTIKILVAIGGWTQNSPNFSKVVGNSNLRAKFVQNVVDFVKKWNIDGFDLDWEYPSQRDGSSPTDKDNFVLLIKELRKKFDAEGFLLTAAVGASKHHRDLSYHVPEVSHYLHYINVMAYDLHYYGEHKIGHNAPLYASPIDESPELNVFDIMHGWIKDGAAPEKLILGLGFYGRSFAAADARNHSVGATVYGPAEAGVFTREAGTLSYLEICQNLKFKNWAYGWDDLQKVPFATKDNQFVSFDDKRSLALKMDLAKELNLGGVMMWSIEQDDIRNVCGEGHFPLLNFLNEYLGIKSEGNGNVAPPTLKPTPSTSPRPTTTTTQGPTTTLKPGKPGDCGPNGLAADINNCSRFFLCTSDGNKYPQECPPGTKFDAAIGGCNFGSC